MWYNIIIMKNGIIIFIVLVLIGIGAYFLLGNRSDTAEVPGVSEFPNGSPNLFEEEPAVKTDDELKDDDGEMVIGRSVQGRDITAYHYGNGDTKLLFVGGIHGGYSWNTVLVAYEMMDYLEANPEVIPDNVEVTVIPVLNPDGLLKVAGSAGRFAKADVSASPEVRTSGRFNANNVDLNRNFDCGWQTTGVWQKTEVDGGSKVFSEPESRALRDYVNAQNPDAVVVWYSAAGGVYASNCHEGVLPETLTLSKIYSQASGYPAYEKFDFYELTGDMVNWLARKNIPAISVLLTTHEDVEWDKNRAGIEALIQNFAK